MSLVLKTAFFTFLLQTLLSCDSKRVFEENKTIPEYIWHNKDKVYFEVDLTDTSSYYNVYVNVRNASHYPFSNLYLFLETQYPDKTFSRDTLECILADPSGKWLGDGSGDIWDNQILFKRHVKFKQAGRYSFGFEQGMRVTKLPMIMDVGLRIEKE